MQLSSPTIHQQIARLTHESVLEQARIAHAARRRQSRRAALLRRAVARVRTARVRLAGVCAVLWQRPVRRAGS